MIRNINSKDLINFKSYCKKPDDFSDFYILKDNRKHSLSNNKTADKVFNDCVKRSDICYIKEDNNIISGVLLVTGFVDKQDKKFIKILADNNEIASDLLKMLTWEHGTDLYIKINRENPLKYICCGFGFKFVEAKNKEILYFRQYNERFDYTKKPRYVKEGDA